MKIFPVYYFPPVSWFTAAISEDKIQLEQHIHYRKQNYFNRMRVKGSNRIQMLSVPVTRSSEDTPYHLKTISYFEDWRKNHWKTLESAYRSAPYFEFYESRLEPIFEEKFDRLLDLNVRVLEFLREALQIDLEWELTEAFDTDVAPENDYRFAFDARGKKFPEWFKPAEYLQVFDGFDPDLTILDLLFNTGPEAILILKNSRADG